MTAPDSHHPVCSAAAARGADHSAADEREDDGQMTLFDPSTLIRGAVTTTPLTEDTGSTFEAETKQPPASPRKPWSAGTGSPTPPTAQPTAPLTTSLADSRSAAVPWTRPATAAEAIGADEVATLSEMIGHERDVVSRLWRCVDDLRTVQDSKDALSALHPAELSRALERRHLRLVPFPQPAISPSFDPSSDPAREPTDKQEGAQ